MAEIASFVNTCRTASHIHTAGKQEPKPGRLCLQWKDRLPHLEVQHERIKQFQAFANPTIGEKLKTYTIMEISKLIEKAELYLSRAGKDNVGELQAVKLELKAAIGQHLEREQKVKLGQLLTEISRILHILQENGERIVVKNKQSFDWCKVRNGQILVGGRPSEKTIQRLKYEGCNTIVTLQTANEKVDALSKTIQANDIQWIWLPLSASSLPAVTVGDKTHLALKEVAKRLDNGHSVFIHCAAGIHRTGAFTYGLLRYLGFDKSTATALIGSTREVTQRSAIAEHWDWAEQCAGLPL